MAETKRLDPYSEAYKKATLKDLVADAVAANSEEALTFLQTESAKKENRTRDGKNIKVSKNIAAIRALYATKFLNYKPKSKQNAEALRKRKQEKAEKERQEMFERAFAQLK